jgi:hypothetical protein
MMTDKSQPPSRAQIIHEIIWSEAFPWWILFKAAGIAFAPAVILLATLATAGIWAGFSAIDSIGLPSGGIDQISSVTEGCASCESTEILLPTPSRVVLPTISSQIAQLPVPVRELLALVTTPWNPLATWSEFVGSLLRCIWFLLVWSIFATSITRYVALRLVDEELPSFRQVLRFGVVKWPAAFNAAAFVFLGIVALAVPGGLLGLLMRFDWGLAIIGVIWPLILAGAVILAILGIGLAAGWPLMVAAVSVERGDSFQAISTAFSYLYQRPLHFAFYGLVACILAVLGFFCSRAFCRYNRSACIMGRQFRNGPRANNRGNSRDLTWQCRHSVGHTDTTVLDRRSAYPAWIIRVGIFLVCCPGNLSAVKTKC